MTNLFADAFSARDFGPLPVQELTPSLGQVTKAAEMIASAKSPVILVRVSMLNRWADRMGDGFLFATNCIIQGGWVVI